MKKFPACSDQPELPGPIEQGMTYGESSGRLGQRARRPASPRRVALLVIPISHFPPAQSRASIPPGTSSHRAVDEPSEQDDDDDGLGRDWDDPTFPGRVLDAVCRDTVEGSDQTARPVSFAVT